MSNPKSVRVDPGEVMTAEDHAFLERAEREYQGRLRRRRRRELAWRVGWTLAAALALAAAYLAWLVYMVLAHPIE